VLLLPSSRCDLPLRAVGIGPDGPCNKDDRVRPEFIPCAAKAVQGGSVNQPLVSLTEKAMDFDLNPEQSALQSTLLAQGDITTRS
jgi:hypothetical protein